LKWAQNTAACHRRLSNINGSLKKSIKDQDAERHVSSSNNPICSRRGKELLLSFPWTPVRLDLYHREQPVFISSWNLKQPSHFSFAEMRTILCKEVDMEAWRQQNLCVSAVVVGKNMK